MFARLLAAFCLINLAVVPSRASDLVVYLRADAAQPVHTLEIMKRELAPLLLQAGYRVEWRDAQSPGDSTAASLVVLELRGRCGMASGASVPAGETKTLAATSSTDGALLPFSVMNCDALTRVIAPAIVGEAGARRDFLYGRAMARLAAHELYHILAGTREHEKDGVAKPGFNSTDLTTERFDFDDGARSRIQEAWGGRN